MSNQNYKNKKQQATVLETIVLGILKALWFLIKLPFKGIQKKKGVGAEERSRIITKRHEIEGLLNSESMIELKHAVFEADKLVDYALKVKNYSGETFADRLRSAENDIDRSTYQSIWEGHKVRNQLAHESELQIGTSELKSAITKLLKYIRNL